MKKSAFLLLIAIAFTSCKQTVLGDSYICFNEPQPINVEAIKSFSKNYLGTFSMDYSIQLTVNPTNIILSQIDTLEATPKELDSLPEFEFKNNQVYDKESKKAYKTFVKNDTIKWEIKRLDTIFSFAENEVAKIYKCSLILNTQVDGNYQVSYIKYNGLGTEFVQLGTKKDAKVILEKIKIPNEIITENNDTTHVIFTPTRGDFRKLLRLDGMEYETNYHFK